MPGTTGKIIHGLAYAPADAPLQVQEVIWAGDRIRFKPYVYAGGHGRWNDVGYDCSGTVSYVLHAAGMLKVSMDSSQFETWGKLAPVSGSPSTRIRGTRSSRSPESDSTPRPSKIRIRRRAPAQGGGR